MKRTRATVASLFALAWLLIGPGGTHALDHGDDSRIRTACLAAGRGVSACSCVTREAHSRFTPEQLAVLGAAMPDLDRITDDPWVAESLPPAQRLTPEQLQQLRRRADAADQVIRQACGTGLRLDPPT